MDWNKHARGLLLGKVITGVEYMTKEDSETLGLYHQPIMFCLDNTTWCFPMSDDEGNDGGALAIGQSDTLPVMRD